MAAPIVLSGTGLGALPDQLHAVAADRGFTFNLMVAGESGLGKSTFLNALFASELHQVKPYSNGDYLVPPTAKPTAQTFVLTEEGVRLTLTLIDTPGFGTSLDNTDCWEPLQTEISRRLAAHMDSEAKVDREVVLPDNRVHCLLYFIAPTGHGLKPLDAAVLRELQPLVNIVPVIGKGDLLTLPERKAFRERIAADLHKAGVTCFPLPPEETDGGEEAAAAAAADPPAAPFCVSAGPELGGRPFGGARVYPWGEHTPADPVQSDAALLRRLLIGTHLVSLVRATDRDVYERFRAGALAAAAGGGRSATPLADFNELKEDRSRKREDSEAEMKAAFQRTVAAQEKELRELEAALLDDHEVLQRDLEALKRDLELQAAEFAAEKEHAEAKPAPPPSAKKSKRLFK